MQAATRKIDASGDREIDAGGDGKVVWRLQRESGCRLCGTCLGGPGRDRRHQQSRGRPQARSVTPTAGAVVVDVEGQCRQLDLSTRFNDGGGLDLASGLDRFARWGVSVIQWWRRPRLVLTRSRLRPRWHRRWGRPRSSQRTRSICKMGASARLNGGGGLVSC
jgi:hypothetical protein